MTNSDTTDGSAIYYLRKLQRWRMAFFGMVILVAGIAIGGASMFILVPDRLMQPPPGPEFGSFRTIEMLRRELGLSPEQEKKIKPILDAHMKRLHEIRMEARTEIQSALNRMNKGISDVLTDEQKQLWQRSLDRLEMELHRGGPPRRGGGPGGRGGREDRFREGPPERFRDGPGPRGPRRPPGGPNSPPNGTGERPTDY